MLPHGIYQVLERRLFKLCWCYQITEQLVCHRTNGCQEEGCLLPVIRNAIRCEKMFHLFRVMGPIFFSRVEFPNLANNSWPSPACGYMAAQSNPPTEIVAAQHNPPTEIAAAQHNPPTEITAAQHNPPTEIAAAQHNPPTEIAATEGDLQR